jgi:hypothetical protein
MIPARRMLTEIPLVIQILMSVYMIPPLIPGTDAGISPKWDEHIDTIIPARRDEPFPSENA